MAKTTKKDKEDLKEWLLDFEKKIGKGIVVSLLIEDGNVRFVSCVDKKRYLGKEDDFESDEDEEPKIDFERRKKDVRTHLLKHKDYIG